MLRNWLDVEYRIGSLPPKATGPVAIGFTDAAIAKAELCAEEFREMGFTARVRAMMVGRELAGFQFNT